MNIRKPYLTLPSITLVAGLCMQATSSSASPLVSIGDNADLYFNGSSSLRWDSNVFRDGDDTVDDVIWTISPGFELNVGRGLSNADLSIITRYDIVRYSDLDELNSERFYIGANGSYQSSRLDLSASASFQESSSTSGNVDTFDDANINEGEIVTNNYQAAINGEYRFSPKFSIGSGFSYRETEYKTFENRFPDRNSITVPVDVFYELTPKIDLSLGYSYSQTDTDETLRETGPGVGVLTGDYESETHFFNIGARGNLLPKLTGFFKIGYRTRSVDDSTLQAATFPAGVGFGPVTSTDKDDDSGMLGLDASLTWAATAKITANLDLSRDYGVGGEGQSTVNSSVRFGASYSINSYFSANANFGYKLRDYTDTGREDNQYTAGLGLNYTPDQHWRFGVGYDYVENDSDRADSSYDQHSFNLSATLRY